MLIDRFGRQMTYLRVSVSDRCNLRCRYCMPEHGIPLLHHGDLLTFEEIESLVRLFASAGVSKVRLTGGEPLLRRGIVSLVAKLASIDGILDLSLTTNGLLLPRFAADLKKAGLNRVNISLDTLDPARFRELTRGGDLAVVLAGIRAAQEHGLGPVKLNVVLVRGFNDGDIETLVDLTVRQPLDVRFIELMPMGEQADWSNDHFLSGVSVLKKVPALVAESDRDPASPAVYYRIPGAPGRVGLISPLSCGFCAGCNRLRLTADGKLKSCLHSDSEFDLRSVLRAGGSVDQEIRRALEEKKQAHGMKEGCYVHRGMAEVGG